MPTLSSMEPGHRQALQWVGTSCVLCPRPAAHREREG